MPMVQGGLSFYQDLMSSASSVLESQFDALGQSLTMGVLVFVIFWPLSCLGLSFFSTFAFLWTSEAQNSVSLPSNET